MAHFQLAPGDVAIGVYHRTIDELWYFVSGTGRLWRHDGQDSERVIDVGPGTSVSIPCGTHFQFRCVGAEPLAAVAVNVPPWPGDGEAVRSPLAPWPPTVAAGARPSGIFPSFLIKGQSRPAAPPG